MDSGLGFFAMFLLGLYTGKRGIFLDIDRHVPLLRRGVVWGLSLGAVAMVVQRAIAPGLQRDLVFAYGWTALCLGYAAAIALLARREGARWLLEPLGRVGRFALTVYLTQTLAFTTLFYGYGFGWAFRLGPAAVTACAALIFGLQVIACTWWARRFRYGPAEWLWRAMTYLQLPPMRARA